MEYLQLETRKGQVSIKDANLEDLEKTIDVYKDCFKVHTIFQKPRKEVWEYLREKTDDTHHYGGGFLVAVNPKKSVVGSVLLRREHCDGNHTRWKYNNFCVDSKFRGDGVGKALISAADKKIMRLIKRGDFGSAKMMVTVAENEKESIDFYVDNCGFSVEGNVNDYYRLDENVTFLGKTIR